MKRFVVPELSFDGILRGELDQLIDQLNEQGLHTWWPALVESIAARYPVLGTAGRKVIALNDTHVLKLAFARGSFKQNLRAAQIYQAYQDLPVPAIYYVGVHYLYLLSERVELFNPTVFKEVYGTTFDKVAEVLNLMATIRFSQPGVDYSLFTNLVGELPEQAIELLAHITETKLDPGKLSDVSQWGTLRGHPVILDTGFLLEDRRNHRPRLERRSTDEVTSLSRA